MSWLLLPFVNFAILTAKKWKINDFCTFMQVAWSAFVSHQYSFIIKYNIFFMYAICVYNALLFIFVVVSNILYPSAAALSNTFLLLYSLLLLCCVIFHDHAFDYSMRMNFSRWFLPKCFLVALDAPKNTNTTIMNMLEELT